MFDLENSHFIQNMIKIQHLFIHFFLTLKTVNFP
jgi:hypothetical protein